MTSKEAERLCRDFRKSRWPAGITCEVFPVSDQGEDCKVILAWTVRGRTRHREVKRADATQHVQRYYREALAYRDSLANGGIPPSSSITATATDEPRNDWIAQTVIRMLKTDATPSVCKLAKDLLIALEFESLPLPEVDEIDGSVFISWEEGGRHITLGVSSKNASVTVLDDTQPIPWASDVHLWRKPRAVPSLRVWLRWMFPELAEISPSAT